MLRDPEFGPIRLRAFGTYSLKAADPRALLRELVGTDASFDTDEIHEFIRSVINTAFADVIGESKIAALDLAAKYQEFSEILRKKAVERIDDEFGFDIPQLYIVNISLPEAVEKALDTRTSMGVIGDMNRFQQYQMGQAMTAAAENPSGGGAAEGMGLGMGFAMAGKMMQGANAGAPTPGSMPPPPPGGVWHIAANGAVQGQCTMAQIPAMVAQGAITPETMVWSAGMGTWMAAGQVPQLAGFFNAAPPPPPPK